MLLSSPTQYTVDLTTDSGPTSAGSGTGTAGDLRYCINQANADPNLSGSLITFDPAVFATPQTITLSSPPGPGNVFGQPSLDLHSLELSESAGPEFIQGPGANLLTISGGGPLLTFFPDFTTINVNFGVFKVDSGVTATLSGLTISKGDAINGGGIENAGTLTVSDCSIANNSAGSSGSSAYSASNNGGGIWNAGMLTRPGQHNSPQRRFPRRRHLCRLGGLDDHELDGGR